MPTYDYRCNACGHEFEEFQSITAPVKRKCPECGRLKLERLIGTGAGVIFKGGGFYETDYRSDSYKKGAEAAKKSESGSSGDSKGAAKDGSKGSADSTTGSKSDSSTGSSSGTSSGSGSGSKRGSGDGSRSASGASGRGGSGRRSAPKRRS